jgi:hypothetical protein
VLCETEVDLGGRVPTTLSFSIAFSVCRVRLAHCTSNERPGAFTVDFRGKAEGAKSRKTRKRVRLRCKTREDNDYHKMTHIDSATEREGGKERGCSRRSPQDDVFLLKTLT